MPQEKNERPFVSRLHRRQQLVERQVAQIGEGDPLRQAANPLLEQAFIALVAFGTRRDHQHPFRLGVQGERQVERLPVDVVGNHPGHIPRRRAIAEVGPGHGVEHDRRVGEQVRAVGQEEVQGRGADRDHHIDASIGVLADEIIAQHARLRFARESIVLQVLRVVLDAAGGSRSKPLLHGLFEDRIGPEVLSIPVQRHDPLRRGRLGIQRGGER